MSLIIILTAPIWAGLIYGLERKFKARIQARKGPPLLQPFYDLAKLAQKKVYIANPLHASLGLMHFFASWITLGLLLYGIDLLVVVFFHLFATATLVVAGFSVRSPFSAVGAYRQLLMVIATEPILILAALCLYVSNGTLQDLWHASNNLQETWLALLAVIVILPIALKKSPFDSAEAHQEIVGGAEIEFGGIFYEAVYGAKWLDMIFCYAFIALFAGDNYILGIAVACSVFFVVNIIDNSTARLTPVHTLKIALSIALPLVIANLIGASL